VEPFVQLVLNEDQELLAKTATDFVSDKAPISHMRKLRDEASSDGFSRALWKEMAELGWVGIPFDEEHGGSEMGLAEMAVVLEPLGRALAPEPFLSTVLLGGMALALGGTQKQQVDWLRPAIEGDRFLTLAYQERTSRFELTRVQTRANANGDGWRLSGEKIQVPDGGVADALVVSARTEGGDREANGITLFLVPRDAPGLSIQRQHRVDSRNSALVRLDDVKVGREAIVGEAGQGSALLERVVDRATVGLCAEMLGAMSEAFDRTLEYLKTREQFGAPIGSFQGLKHRAAEMFIEIELCRSTVMAAARAVDTDDPESTLLVSLAKARCSDAAIQVANEAIQMHGGIGMTDEHDIGFYLKRARVAEMTFGDSAHHRNRWARLSGY
jgi:alkylation response protein AidB-like acyl-CoA dehydrogenase